MTRGTFICISDDDGNCLKSTEFNGDMYIEQPGYGLEAYDLCRNVKSKDEFIESVRKFDDKNFQYGDTSFKPMNINLGFHKDNYGKWNYSDYMYIVNLSETEFTVDSYNKDEPKIKIQPHSVKVLYFGEDFDFESAIAKRRADNSDN